jgi:thiol-disulfide isomerase/thioredoxin
VKLALQLTCALLVLAAGYLMFASAGAPDGWPAVPDAQGDTLPTPPKPSPLPIPTPPRPSADETHEAAFERSAESGRPVILLFGERSCPPCRVIDQTMLPAVRAKGELARIDVERRRDLYDYYCLGASVPHLMVYDRTATGWKFRVRFTGADQIGAWAGVRSAASDREPETGKPAEDARAVKSASTRDPDRGLTVVLVTSEKAKQDCQEMRAILGRVEPPWKVSYVDADNPKVAQWLEVYGIKTTPYLITHRGHEALQVTEGTLTEEELSEWLAMVQEGKPAVGRFRKSTAQDSLELVDREYLQMRMAPGSCGMLGCMAHGGGWITETVKGSTPKTAGHWEERRACGPNGCEVKKVWVADPDATGTVPWPIQSGRLFGRRG